MSEIPSRKSFHNLLNHPPFERLTVIAFAGYVRLSSRPFPSWECQCICGNRINVDTQSLLKGHTRSCGCLQKEATVRMGHANKTHGKRHTKEYLVWHKMLRRCYDENDNAYLNYGGRGIVVCERWRTSFGNFIEDMGPRPSDKHSIDRFPDNDGPYSPDNCRWATLTQQARNKRNTIFLTLNGITRSLAEWSEVTGFNKQTLMTRYLANWSHERILTTKPRMISNHF